MPKDKAGNQLTWKEWLQRWKRGIEGITPLQQVNIQLQGSVIIIIGLCSGIFITTLNLKSLWWLCIILVGGLFNAAMQTLGQWQKKQILSRLFKPDIKEPSDRFNGSELVNVKFTDIKTGMGGKINGNTNTKVFND